jgi:uncharacterized protein HemX
MTTIALAVPIVVAAISAVVGPLLVIRRQHQHDLKLQELQKENTEQHAEGRSLLGGLHQDVRDLAGKIERVDERTVQIKDSMGHVREWIHTHEIRHAVDEIERDKPT